MNRMQFRALSRGSLIAALLVCLPLGNAWATHRDEAEQAIAEAKAAHEAAAAAKVATPETATLIEQAEELIPSRQYTKAVDLANRAKRQDRFALEQSGGEAEGKSNADARHQAEEAIVAAETARKKASSVGGEWRDTAKMIAEAESLAKSGSYEEAIALAEQARRQGEKGYAQSVDEQDAGFPSYVLKQP